MRRKVAGRLKKALKEMVGRAAYYSGGFLLVRLVRHRLFGPAIPILYYHRVQETPDFEKHLRHLKRYYKVIPLAEAVASLRGDITLASNAIVITFDDGYQDNYTQGLPLLVKYNLPATVFVVTSALDGTPLWLDKLDFWFASSQAKSLRFPAGDKQFDLIDSVARERTRLHVRAAIKSLRGDQLPGALADIASQLRMTGAEHHPHRPVLTWDQLREMTRTGLITVGSHTLSHAILPNLSAEQIGREIGESCEAIAQKLGVPVQFFAYPQGSYNRAVLALVRRLGLIACTTGRERFNRVGDDLTTLSRLGADGLPLFRFVLYVAGWELVVARLRAKCRSLLAGSRWALSQARSIGNTDLL